ncbi:hypothetical protein C8R46DRAFT_1030581 [Mycena filopes]|nr:hypothetical protein C8R46DRAFT_1030581 [Mycena filopes]
MTGGAYGYLGPLLDGLDAISSKTTLPSNLREDLGRTIENIKNKAFQRPYKLVMVGQTGWQVHTVECTVAKTGFVSIVVAFSVLTMPKDIPTIQGIVEFISREQWAEDLGRLIGDIMDTTVRNENGDKEINFLPAYISRQKAYAIYPYLRQVPEENWKINELLEDPMIEHFLGKVHEFVAQEDVNVQKQLEQFLAAALTGVRSLALWPLVKRVQIMGRFDVLSTGITLVDLPGHGAVDTRDTRVNEYLRTADAGSIANLNLTKVAGMTAFEAKHDIRAYIRAHLSQTIMHGRIEEKSILVALTSADEIKILREKKRKREKSKAKKHAPGALQKMHEQLGRCTTVSEVLQAEYTQLYRDLSRFTANTDVPPIPIFCVGSRDFLRILQVEDMDDPVTFHEPEETGIPHLQSYLRSQGEHQTIGEAIKAVSEVSRFLGRLGSTQSPPNLAKNPGGTTTIQTVINDLEQNQFQCCEAKLLTMTTAIGKVYVSTSGFKVHSRIFKDTGNPNFQFIPTHYKQTHYIINKACKTLRFVDGLSGLTLSLPPAATVAFAMNLAFSVLLSHFLHSPPSTFCTHMLGGGRHHGGQRTQIPEACLEMSRIPPADIWTVEARGITITWTATPVVLTCMGAAPGEYQVPSPLLGRPSYQKIW